MEAGGIIGIIIGVIVLTNSLTPSKIDLFLSGSPYSLGSACVLRSSQTT
jgi:hypothetical protein